MKKLSYIALLSMLLLQSGGLVLIYKVQQCMVQNEMKSVLNNHETRFQPLTISLSVYKKNIFGNEIVIDGKLYDVNSIAISGNTVHLQVINDTKEESILEKIKDLISGTTKHNRLPIRLVQLLSLNYILPHSHYDSALQQISQQNFLPLSTNILSLTKDVSSPPPKFN
ncbi:MAG: hypothetical protein ACMG51_00640 [Ginsengibacter sp.]